MEQQRHPNPQCRARNTITTLPAYQVFVEMSNHQEMFTGGVLRVIVHHVYYRVNEETLQQVCTAYGVVKISMFQRIHHVEAVVQL